MKCKLLAGIIAVFCLIGFTQAEANCTETGAGRFADPDDDTCKNYTLCVYDSSTETYIAYEYVCPTTSLFDADTQECTDSADYVCNVTSSDSSNSSVCTEDGYFADPDSTNCTTYIECVELNGTFTETTLTCPDDTYFDPNTTLCESDYNCTSTNSTTDSTTFTCTSAGRFADSSDTTCQTYYLCVETSDGTYTEYTYTCPSTSVFDPDTSECTDSANYTCDN